MIMIVVLTQTTSLLNHLKPLLCYVMLFPPDNRKHVIIMTFRPSNERGRGRTDYRAGRILIPHRIGLHGSSAVATCTYEATQATASVKSCSLKKSSLQCGKKLVFPLKQVISHYLTSILPRSK